eukprot:scaffold1340_cov253-Pinguiococcus_pyrenoidosus.AAC.29
MAEHSNYFEVFVVSIADGDYRVWGKARASGWRPLVLCTDKTKLQDIWIFSVRNALISLGLRVKSADFDPFFYAKREGAVCAALRRASDHRLTGLAGFRGTGARIWRPKAPSAAHMLRE